MASYRIGIGSFNLKDGNIGIGTETTGFGNLKVEGTIKTTDLDVTGVSTFTRYSGFEAEQTNIIRDATYGDNEPVTYTVTVIGGIFYIDGVSAPILTLKRGTTYTFDQSPNTNNGHPLRFKDGDGNSYSNGVTATGTAGSSGAKVTLVVASNAPDDLRYYCTVHGNGMGNTISVINRTPSNLETTGDIVVDTGKTLTVGSGATISVGSVECISVKNHFSVPVGDTAGRNKSSGYAEGTVRYIRDLGTIEFYNGNEWRQFRYQSDASNSPSRRGRGLFGGGLGPSSPTYVNTEIIDYVNIASQGNAINFGNLTGTYRGWITAFASETRGLWHSGSDYPGNNRENTIDYVTIASEGNAIDFGDSTDTNGFSKTSCSSSTRGIIAGGYTQPGNVNVNTIEYVEISTLGNGQDFGDIVTTTRGMGSTGSPTRVVFGGGIQSNDTTDMTFVIISSKGNSVRFGDLTSARRMDQQGQMSNSVRGLFNQANAPSGDGIDYITIASEGNAVFFTDGCSGIDDTFSCSNMTRALNAGGRTPAITNIIEFVTFSTSGQVNDFGDLSIARIAAGGCSDSHGGLGGY